MKISKILRPAGLFVLVLSLLLAGCNKGTDGVTSTPPASPQANISTPVATQANVSTAAPLMSTAPANISIQTATVAANEDWQYLSTTEGVKCEASHDELGWNISLWASLTQDGNLTYGFVGTVSNIPQDHLNFTGDCWLELWTFSGKDPTIWLRIVSEGGEEYVGKVGPEGSIDPLWL